MLHPQRKTMDLVPLVCLCLLTWSAGTAADHKPVVVKEGSDVVLPCSPSTQENLVGKLFDWQKDGEKKKEVFVYDAGIHYNNGRDGQDQQFKGRVSHFEDQLKNGNASIQIRDTKIADSGTYTCHFPRLQPPQTFHIELAVGAAPEPSVKTLKTDDGVLLQCVVRGVSPQPKVELKDSAGNILPAKQPQVTQRGGSYDVILQATVTKTDTFTCVVTQEEINHQVSADIFAVPLNGAAPEPSVVTLKTDDGVLLQCVVRGVSPQPKVEWKDSAGNILPAKEPQVTERGGSYDVILQAPVTKTDTFTCVVTQEELYHQVYTETYVHFSAATGLVVGVSVPIVLLVVGFVLVETEL